MLTLPGLLLLFLSLGQIFYSLLLRNFFDKKTKLRNVILENHFDLFAKFPASFNGLKMADFWRITFLVFFTFQEYSKIFVLHVVKTESWNANIIKLDESNMGRAW